jgi:WD40 repeat protein
MWHVHTGRLLATFRGHSKEICDIDINFENTLVASASLDKKVRVWNLKTTKMECVLHGHQSAVNATRVCLIKNLYIDENECFF